MKRILILCMLIITSNILHATVYVFTTNDGVLKLNDQMNTISFKGMEYNILDYKENSPEINSVFCEYSNLKKMFLFDFSKGNITEYNYIETFEWKDVAFYNKAKLVSGLYRNIDVYIYNNNIRGDNISLFKQYANIMIEGIKNGTIIMNGNGTFTDTTGKLSSSGTFERNWLGKKKNTSNNILNLVADYIFGYIKGMPSCNSNWEQVGNLSLILKADKLN